MSNYCANDHVIRSHLCQNKTKEELKSIVDGSIIELMKTT